ncbi:MAG: phosphoribosylamine--glycine ligase [Candidatus Edwardsbacteria bacterium]|nr:phosphoribosylamine--glycine ligase [Candidatus Edwardsbacteria bacterium]MBU1576319.1 phosphoribosylamine--glycine ligase [Candidatus Edwardsbacteria bacterium]MBU2463246.1 phosphoribosylamine--glycine ligase [Candidatus Edwardsbacteria bacterium]MBU2593932.1 phosphoribosylamine--glycine ligase [Candidatus Edwardsbacteria bacterium]
MKILIIGSGGREHALTWKLAQSPKIDKLYCAPGNPGMAEIAECVDISADKLESLRDFALNQQVDITMIGPDDCLAAGIVDVFQQAGLKVFGPSQKAARIESSKSYAKKLMAKAGIPTAQHAEFDDHQKALEYLISQKYPLVIKADGLALGKGVFICHSPDEAVQAIKSMMVDGNLGQAGSKVIIEEFLEGQEISIHAFCDGGTAKLFPSAQDHKAAYDGDQGPNTGGMGTYAPVSWVNDEMIDGIERQIVNPILKALAEDGNPFSGCLYPGLIYTKDGFKVLEFNARFGDPETQSYMRLLETDLLEIIEACIGGRLSELDIRWSDGSACCIVAASGGYPGSCQKGFAVNGIDKAQEKSGIVVFQAGTKKDNGDIVTSGGRVLGVTAIGKDLKESLEKGYDALAKINFNGMHFRKDIGRKGLQ